MVELFVEDQGAGFDAEPASGRKGIGLVGMEERARLLGAEFEVESKPGVGTRIRVRVPIS